MQRLCVLGLLVTALWALGVQGRVFRSLVRAQLVFALLGLYFAARQLWLQSLPVEHTGVCLPGLKLLAQYMPWRDLVPLLFLGSPACNEILWQAWGFSMAAWSALFFAVEGGGLLWLLWA
jgi:disulfide bond formation protein DsbB